MKEEERTQQRQDNRRKFARHKISFPLELRDERVNTPLRVNATDISGNGCYVETVMPLAVGTALRVDLWIERGAHLSHRRGSHSRSRRRNGHRIHGHARRIEEAVPGSSRQARPRHVFRQQRRPIAPSLSDFLRHSCKICNHCPFQPSNDRSHEKAALAHEDRNHLLSDVRR